MNVDQAHGAEIAVRAGAWAAATSDAEFGGGQGAGGFLGAAGVNQQQAAVFGGPTTVFHRLVSGEDEVCPWSADAQRAELAATSRSCCALELACHRRVPRPIAVMVPNSVR